MTSKPYDKQFGDLIAWLKRNGLEMRTDRNGHSIVRKKPIPKGK